VDLCSCSSSNPAPDTHVGQLHRCLQITFSLAFSVDLQEIASLQRAKFSLSKYFYLLLFLTQRGNYFLLQSVFKGWYGVWRAGGGGDVWVEQGHLVQYVGSPRIRSIMPGTALHNLKVTLASETCPHLCQADVFPSAVFVYCLTFMAVGEMHAC